jgi:hypothetical protein
MTIPNCRGCRERDMEKGKTRRYRAENRLCGKYHYRNLLLEGLGQLDSHGV